MLKNNNGHYQKLINNFRYFLTPKLIFQILTVNAKCQLTCRMQQSMAVSRRLEKRQGSGGG